MKEYLPGNPTRQRVKLVRLTLRNFGIRPKHPYWHQTWEWAYAVARSYILREMWPSNREIATQYLFLVLSKMRDENLLHLPCRAFEEMPAHLCVITAGPIPQLTAAPGV